MPRVSCGPAGKITRSERAESAGKRGDVVRGGQHAHDLRPSRADGVRRPVLLEGGKRLLELGQREAIRERLEDRPGQLVAGAELDQLGAERALS